MTYPTYTQQALCRYNLPRLKRIATELGVTPTGDKRATDTWVNAIITHQSTKLQKVDNQAAAQAELNDHIATQAQAIAPESLTTVEISFYDHEIYCGKELVASITHDDDLTQPWVVMVDGKEKFRANTWARCHRFIQWHHQDSTLNEATPAATETPCTAENRIMAHIFNECQKYGFEILDDGIYQNEVKLGQVGCTDGNWWVIRGSSAQQYSNSVFDAVQALSMVEVLSTPDPDGVEELLDQPFDELTPQDWERLREYATFTEEPELVAA